MLHGIRGTVPAVKKHEGRVLSLHCVECRRTVVGAGIGLHAPHGAGVGAPEGRFRRYRRTGLPKHWPRRALTPWRGSLCRSSVGTAQTSRAFTVCMRSHMHPRHWGTLHLVELAGYAAALSLFTGVQLAAFNLCSGFATYQR